jgi:tRNA pseudouridine55 synthase
MNQPVPKPSRAARMAPPAPQGARLREPKASGRTRPDVAFDSREEGDRSETGRPASEPDAAWREAPPSAQGPISEALPREEAAVRPPIDGKDVASRAPGVVAELERCDHIAPRSAPSQITRLTDVAACGGFGTGWKAPESGLYLVHKLVGETSFDVVRRFKARAREAGEPKLALGHGGTLDPFAEGLLLILAGQATRLMELMHPLPKTYIAEIAWGVETDTCDLHGKQVDTGDPSTLTVKSLEMALAPFLGWQDQVPPTTSAKKIDGEAAYKKAHRGEIVEMRPSRVYLHEASWMSHDLPNSSILSITCRGGFYVRSLARDLGRALGCGAHLRRLQRTAIGPWQDPGAGQECHISGEALVPWCPTRYLDDEEFRRLSQGQAIDLGTSEPPSWNLPDGFPDPSAPIRGIHLGRLVSLLKDSEVGFRTQANLRGGL